MEERVPLSAAVDYGRAQPPALTCQHGGRKWPLREHLAPRIRDRKASERARSRGCRHCSPTLPWSTWSTPTHSLAFLGPGLHASDSFQIALGGRRWPGHVHGEPCSWAEPPSPDPDTSTCPTGPATRPFSQFLEPSCLSSRQYRFTVAESKVSHSPSLIQVNTTDLVERVREE